MESSYKFKISLNKRFNKSLNKMINNQAIIFSENSTDDSKQFQKEKLKQSNLPLYKNRRFGIQNEYHIEKRRNNIRDNKAIKRNYILIDVIKAILINILFCQIKSKTSDLFYFQNESIIELKIKGKGESKFLGDFPEYYAYFDYPDEIIINGNNNDNLKINKIKSFVFTEANNTVQLKWNNNITKCTHMFSGCSNITEIDLSQFDSSKVEIMTGMFQDDKYVLYVSKLYIVTYNKFI